MLARNTSFEIRSHISHLTFHISLFAWSLPLRLDERGLAVSTKQPCVSWSLYEPLTLLAWETFSILHLAPPLRRPFILDWVWL